MERKLTEVMLHKIAEDVCDNWDKCVIIDELIWLYDNLAKHDKDLYEVLIENYERLAEEDAWLSKFKVYEEK